MLTACPVVNVYSKPMSSALVDPLDIVRNPAFQEASYALMLASAAHKICSWFSTLCHVQLPPLTTTKYSIFIFDFSMGTNACDATIMMICFTHARLLAQADMGTTRSVMCLHRVQCHHRGFSGSLGPHTWLSMSNQVIKQLLDDRASTSRSGRVIRSL